jgi:hypothetical protein
LGILDPGQKGQVAPISQGLTQIHPAMPSLVGTKEWAFRPHATVANITGGPLGPFQAQPHQFSEAAHGGFGLRIPKESHFVITQRDGQCFARLKNQCRTRWFRLSDHGLRDQAHAPEYKQADRNPAQARNHRYSKYRPA